MLSNSLDLVVITSGDHEWLSTDVLRALECAKGTQVVLILHQMEDFGPERETLRVLATEGRLTLIGLGEVVYVAFLNYAYSVWSLIFLLQSPFSPRSTEIMSRKLLEWATRDADSAWDKVAVELFVPVSRLRILHRRDVPRLTPSRPFRSSPSPLQASFETDMTSRARLSSRAASSTPAVATTPSSPTCALPSSPILPHGATTLSLPVTPSEPSTATPMSSHSTSSASRPTPSTSPLRWPTSSSSLATPTTRPTSTICRRWTSSCRRLRRRRISRRRRRRPSRPVSLRACLSWRRVSTSRCTSTSSLRRRSLTRAV